MLITINQDYKQDGMITIYTVAYNEELFIKFMIDHYRERFPNCKIIVYNNFSTDNTAKIALDNGAEVVNFDTNNLFCDSANVSIKNNFWKIALTDWVLTCDIDELLDINEDQLRYEESLGSTIIRSEAYDMVNLEDNLDLASMKFGIRNERWDKPFLFNKRFIREMNYEVGCHYYHPIGQIRISDRAYKAYHYKYINEDFLVARTKSFGARLSPENIQNKWGVSISF